MRRRFSLYLVIGFAIIAVFTGLILILSRKSGQAKQGKLPDVALPTIYNGSLVLPTVTAGSSGLSKIVTDGRLSVVSANLTAVYDSNKLTGIRVVGEIQNSGDKTVSEVSPVVRLIDASGNVVAQKIAHPTTGFNFHDLASQDTTLYDVTVDDPPVSDRLEILFNVTASTESAVFEPLKIASRSMETKTANMGGSNNSTDSASTESAQPVQTVKYYVVSGRIVNPFEAPVTNITVYAWAKDDNNKVFAVGHTDFKNDLINPGDGADFKVMIIPLRTDETYSSYEVAAWGQEYKLSP